MLKTEHRALLRKLITAGKDGRLSLVECADVETGAPAIALCVVQYQDTGVQLEPVARLFDTPYGGLLPPDIERIRQ